MTPDGTYKDRAYTRTEFHGASRDLLAPFKDIRLSTEDSKGNVKDKSYDRILKEYSTAPTEIYYDATVEKPIYNTESKTLVLPACVPRVDPVYDQEIQTWLECLGGDLLVDMTAGMGRLGEMLPALILTGPKGSGKSLYAVACGQMYGCNPIDSAQAHSEFNGDQMLRQPVIFHDESPGAAYRKEGTTLIRRMVTQRERHFNEKYRIKARMVGFPRIIFAMNSVDSLMTQETMTPEDREAFAQRLVHIELAEEHTAWCEENQKMIADEWLKQNKLAKHFRWLVLNREIKNKGKRFLVEAPESLLHKSLAGLTEDASNLLHWILRYLENPAPIDSRGLPVQVNREKAWLRINAQAVADGWDTYIKTPPISPNRIVGALKSVCVKGRGRQKIKINSKDFHCLEIDPQHLLHANSRMQVLTEERFFDIFGQEVNT
jgi:hypothetical protein